MSEINITPLHDRVIVKRDEAVDKTEGGIIIPDTAKEKPNRGDVVVSGKGKKMEEISDALDSPEFADLIKAYRDGQDNAALDNIKSYIQKVLMITVKDGDKVLYDKGAGSEIEVDGTKYLIMREGNIWAVIGNKKAPTLQGFNSGLPFKV